jgi:hypothetical protein
MGVSVRPAGADRLVKNSSALSLTPILNIVLEGRTQTEPLVGKQRYLILGFTVRVSDRRSDRQCRSPGRGSAAAARSVQLLQIGNRLRLELAVAIQAVEK